MKHGGPFQEGVGRVSEEINPFLEGATYSCRTLNSLAPSWKKPAYPRSQGSGTSIRSRRSARCLRPSRAACAALGTCQAVTLIAMTYDYWELAKPSR